MQDAPCIPGRTLFQALASAPFDAQHAKSVARQIAEGMCAAHKMGIAHGSLNTAKIMLEGSGKAERVLIADWDLTRGNVSPQELRKVVLEDVHAFGEMLQVLAPGHRLASECLADNPEDRPHSFEVVLEEMQAISRHRTWIGSLLITSVISAFWLFQKSLAS